MSLNLLKEYFIEHCTQNNFEKNLHQIEIINLLKEFLLSKKPLFNFYKNYDYKSCFYLYGDVGVGKTMLLDFAFDRISTPKYRSHFNEFMIKFHDFRHESKNNSIANFVKELKKKYKLIYLDEFQVTNIVDAMILGKLFEKIFHENIKVIITSNIQLDKLYKDGLQREQFLPFISIIKKNSIQKEIVLENDYRKQIHGKLDGAFHPLTDKVRFKINQLFRKLTKNKKLKEQIIRTKGRKFKISNFYEGIAKFNFSEICGSHIGAEDYINIAKVCKFIIIEDIPNFTDELINQQQRFIILIDVLYEKNIPLILSSNKKLDLLESSSKLEDSFKRTISRLYELTSIKNFF